MEELNDKDKENEKILIDGNDIEQMDTDDNVKPTIKEKIIYILKAISSILSSIVNTFSYYSILVLGYSGIYLLSFRYHYNKNISYNYLYCFIPLINLSLSITAPLGGTILEKFGQKQTIFLSNLIICISLLFIYFSRSIYLDYILMCLLGFGIASAINITKINACSYFINKKALINGFIYLIPNCLSGILILYNETFILNFENHNPTIKNTFYDEKVFIKFNDVILFEIKIIIITCLATILLFIKNNPKETKRLGYNEKITNENENENNNNDEVEKIEKNKRKIQKIVILKKAIYDKRTIRLILMVMLFFPTITLITNLIRTEESMFFVYGALYNVAGCISCLIFGLIGDLVQFRILFIILSILLLLVCYTFIKYFESDLILLLETILVSFAYNGFNIIFDTHIMKVYGMENFIEIWGIIRSSRGISEILGIILNFALNNKSDIYKIIYGFAGCFSLISLGLAFYENESKFNYE